MTRHARYGHFFFNITFVRDDNIVRCRFADPDPIRRNALPLHIARQIDSARHIGFFVMRKSKVNRFRQLARFGSLHQFRNQGQSARDKTLHIACAATIKLLINLRQLERIVAHSPFFRISRNHIRMTCQNNAAVIRRTDGGKE